MRSHNKISITIRVRIRLEELGLSLHRDQFVRGHLDTIHRTKRGTRTKRFLEMRDHLVNVLRRHQVAEHPSLEVFAQYVRHCLRHARSIHADDLPGGIEFRGELLEEARGLISMRDAARHAEQAGTAIAAVVLGNRKMIPKLRGGDVHKLVKGNLKYVNF